MTLVLLKLLGIWRNVEGMHNEFQYPKSEELIEAGEISPQLGTHTSPPAYLPEMNSV